MKETRDTDRVVEALNNPSLVCRVELFNNTPPQWHSRIISADCSLDYQDGST